MVVHLAQAGTPSSVIPAKAEMTVHTAYAEGPLPSFPRMWE